MNYKSWFGVFVLAGLTACEPDLEVPVYDSGTADFSSYVALGNSLTAGYADGALTRSGQIQSYPNMLASRFALAGGGGFTQPLLPEGNGMAIDLQNNLSGRLSLVQVLNCKQQGVYSVNRLSSDASVLSWIGNAGPYRNMGVPGMKSFNFYSQLYGKGGTIGNPYYYRFASDTGTTGLSSTVLEDALASSPTFFSLWMGSNDALFYALYGGIGSTSGTLPADITPLDTFNYAVDFVVDNLTSNGAKGVILNLPDITDIPFFTTIPWNGLQLSQAEADALNLTVPVGSGIQFSEGRNGFVVRNPLPFDSLKQLTEGELLLSEIPGDLLLCAGLGTPVNPIPAEWVLDRNEVEAVRNAIASYNLKLASVAMEHDLALADINGLFKTLRYGVTYNGVTFSREFVSGGAFSLDGIHPNPKGYAFIANEVIRAINQKYGSNLPGVDINEFSGIIFP